MKTTVLTIIAIISVTVLTLTVVNSSGLELHVRANSSTASHKEDSVTEMAMMMRAVVTGYSSKDSCHYPVAEGCLTASGKIAREGMVACSYLHPFGTEFLINGKLYVCEDRYATWLDRMRGLETVDIFMGYGEEAYGIAKKFGRKELTVYYDRN